MKLSEEKVLAYLSLIVGPNSSEREGEYDVQNLLNLKKPNGDDLEVPLIKVSGSFLSSLMSIFDYVLGPYFQYRTGPLQPEDEVLFHLLGEECGHLFNQIAQKVESTILQVQERKQKENLTARPI